MAGSVGKTLYISGSGYGLAALIAHLQATGLEAGLAVSKSEVLRAGLYALKAMSTDDLRQVFSALEKVKPGTQFRLDGPVSPSGNRQTQRPGF